MPVTTSTTGTMMHTMVAVRVADADWWSSEAVVEDEGMTVVKAGMPTAILRYWRSCVRVSSRGCTSRLIKMREERKRSEQERPGELPADSTRHASPPS